MKTALFSSVTGCSCFGKRKTGGRKTNNGGEAKVETVLPSPECVQALIEAAPPLLILDRNLRVLTANESFCRSFKMGIRQTLNHRLYELGGGEWDIPSLRRLLEVDLPRKGAFDEIELTHRFKKTGLRTMLLSGRFDNKLERIFLFFEDISQCRQAQALIRASELHYRRLFEAAGDGIMIVDPRTGRITEANRHMTEMLELPRKEVIGQELWNIGLLKDEGSCRAAFDELRNKQMLRHDDLPLESRSGRRLQVECVSTFYEEGGRELIQCNVRDITKRKEAEEALLAARNQIAMHAQALERVVVERSTELRETVRELEGFSYSIAHDMRAPLRAMQSFASFLVDEYGKSLDEQGINYLQQIMRSAVRLDKLIQDVLSYSRVLHAQVPLGNVDLDILVNDILKIFESAQPHRAEIAVKGKLPLVTGNEALLAQCIMHLLGNSVKFVAPGKIPRVEISAEEAGDGMVRLCIKDNGLGIATEDHSRIFRLFEKIHPETEYEGTGIGLTIVRKAVERMGAQVGVESELGKGSNFWIQLKKGKE